MLILLDDVKQKHGDVKGVVGEGKVSGGESAAQSREG